jgi:hypothetical protein
MIRARLTGLASFVLTMALLQAAVAYWCGPPRSLALEAKWADFEAHADEYDVVFIGTSHVERHIDPHVVDQTLAEEGLAVRSYNLGLPKMSMLEGNELVGRLDRRRPQRLTLVVIEPTLYLYDADNWATDRAMAEHDWQGTLLAVRLTWASECRRKTSTWGKLSAIAPHMLSFACRTAGLRRGDCFFAATSQPQLATSDVRRGFVPLPVTQAAPQENGWQQRFRLFMAIAVDWRGTGLSKEEIAYFDDMLQHIRRAGARAAFLLGPKVKRDSHTSAVYTSHEREFCEVALLDHLRGHGDSTFDNIRFWHDFDHLNADGAAVFSRQLAFDLAPLLRSGLTRSSPKPSSMQAPADGQCADRQGVVKMKRM